MAEVLVQATNVTRNNLTCIVTATLLAGDDVLEVTDGIVNDMPPGATRPIQMYVKAYPKGMTDVKLDIVACF